MKGILKFTGFLILTSFLYSSLWADVRLPQVLSSDMVFQRGKEIKVWGWSDGNERILVTFNGIARKTRADKEGKWSVVFPEMEAGGPYDLAIKAKNEILLNNILIGDVWICSGQSNMKWTVARSNNAEEEIANASYPTIRLLQITNNFQIEPAMDVPETEWEICSPETVDDFSAVGYFFGRYIHKEVGVPVGLISTSWGGTNIEAWTSEDYITRFEVFSSGNNTNLTPNSVPSSLFNGMINPLLNLAVKGAIWYQGEANASRAYQYRELMPLMIECWRDKWNQPEMPFLMVQLANFRQAKPQPVASDWAELREAQLMTLARLDKVGMAVAIDIGEADDIHPRNKQDVGYRLGLNALKIAYDKDIVYQGPMYESVEFTDGRAILSFTSKGSGLMVKDKYGYLKGFAVAGEDKEFRWARAGIENGKVVVYSEEVKEPVAVRYAWADNPDDANLYNKEGLPASPFRTDDWRGITYGLEK